VRNLGADVLSSEAVFQSAADLANSLDQTCDVQLEKTTVLVDSTTSTDQKPVLAVVTDNPHLPDKQFNWLIVPAKNVDFTRAGVRGQSNEWPGDTIDLFAAPSTQQGETEFERQMLASFGRRGSIKLRVAKVIDPHTIELAAPLNQEVVDPTPIVVTTQYNKRLVAALARIERWQATGQPATGWEPTPDEEGLDRLVARLNEWLGQQQPSLQYALDPFVAAAISPDARQRAEFDELRFAREDGRLLQEAVWARDVARRFAGQGEPLERASALFDWVARNIQLETPESMGDIRQRPWQALISARGTAEERAWIFLLLARQARLDAAVFGLPDPADKSTLNVWTVGVEVAGQWHLFDPALGLAIPGPGGKSVTTLAQAKQDETVLKQLDLDEKNSYPVKAADLSGVVGLIESTPLYWSRRAKVVEAQLAGDQRIGLSAAPSRIAGKLKPHVADVKLWDVAARTLAAQSKMSTAARAFVGQQFAAYAYVPLLWKGRVVQLKGNTYRWEYDYADKRVRTYTRFQDPKVYFLTEHCCPPNEVIKAIEQNKPTVAAALRFAQRNARYWLGLITFEQGDYPAALNHFEARTLKAAPDGPWTHGARYNLARTHEATGETLRRLRQSSKDPKAPIEVPTVFLTLFDDKTSVAPDELARVEVQHIQKAKTLYESDDSPQRHGNRLRARWMDKPLSTDG
jgi:hypothetical protein